MLQDPEQGRMQERERVAPAIHCSLSGARAACARIECRAVAIFLAKAPPEGVWPGGERCWMRLFIRTLRGPARLFMVGEDDEVWKVLSLVSPEELPVDYAATWEGHLLDLTRTLASYGVQQYDVIHAVGAPKVRGSQQRRRRNRQMAEAMVQCDDQQESEAFPVFRSPEHSPVATMLAARAAASEVERRILSSATGPRKRRKVRQ